MPLAGVGKLLEHFVGFLCMSALLEHFVPLAAVGVVGEGDLNGRVANAVVIGGQSRGGAPDRGSQGHPRRQP